MAQIIDRRSHDGKKSTVNRSRLMRRYKKQIKEAVTDVIGRRKMTDVNRGEKIKIPAKDLDEPRFGFGEYGVKEQVLPGNDRFHSGDTINRPKQDKASGQDIDKSNDEGQAEDSFVFDLSRDEFLELYFEDLELPRLVKKELAEIVADKTVKAGFSSTGIPANINVLQSMINANKRRIALKGPLKARLKSLETELKKESDLGRKKIIKEEIAALKKRLGKIPFIDTIDLRYNRREQVSLPTTKAVMFCLMDVSGSMDEAKKNMAKHFFILLYLFLKKHYQPIELIFIRHHTSAKAVSEEDFFYSRETGGTVVSSALELLKDLIKTEYSPKLWNVYVAQASDGDNWNADCAHCKELLTTDILPLVQYYAYVEIMPRHHQSLWDVYQELKQNFSNFSMQSIETNSDIYPVFRSLFEKGTV